MSIRVSQADEGMPCRASQRIETRRSHGGFAIHQVPLLACGTAGTHGRSVLVEKHLFDVLAKNAGDLKSERKARIIAARFDGGDASARYSHMRRQLRLRPLHFRSQYS